MTSALQQLMDTVNAAELERPEDFLADAFALLGLAISILPPTKREATLERIEYDLRRAVQQYPDCGGPRTPEVGRGSLH